MTRADAALLLGQDQHPVGEVDRLLEVMRHHDHRDVLLAPDAGELLLHGDLRHGVERAERLVEQQDLGLHRQRAGDADALRHAARKLARIGVGEVAEADERDVALRPLLGLGLGLAAHLEPEGDVAGAPSATAAAAAPGRSPPARRRRRAPARRRSGRRRRRAPPARPAPAAAWSCPIRWRRR